MYILNNLKVFPPIQLVGLWKQYKFYLPYAADSLFGFGFLLMMMWVHQMHSSFQQKYHHLMAPQLVLLKYLQLATLKIHKNKIHKTHLFLSNFDLYSTHV